MRTRNRPPKFLKGQEIKASNLTHHDSVGIAMDLICFEKSGAMFDGFLKDNPTVLTAYNELKNNPSKVNDYYKLDRASEVS